MIWYFAQEQKMWIVSLKKLKKVSLLENTFEKLLKIFVWACSVLGMHLENSSW